VLDSHACSGTPLARRRGLRLQNPHRYGKKDRDRQYLTCLIDETNPSSLAACPDGLTDLLYSSALFLFIADCG